MNPREVEETYHANAHAPGPASGEVQRGVTDGAVGAKIQSILDVAQPEAVYFSERDGRRGGVVVIDVATPSDIPRFAEPWFLHFDARVEFRICMTPDDLEKAGLAELGMKWA